MYHSGIDRDPATDVVAQQDQPQEAAPGNGRRRTAWLALPVVGLLALFAAKGYLVGPTNAGPPPQSVVTVSTPLQQNVVEWDDYVGRFEASKAVDIKPRVSGQLQSINFHDGDVVQKGQLLFTIDPRPFTAALGEAKAKEAAAVTQLALARAELARATRLIKDEAVSHEEIDNLRAAMQSAQAGVEGAQATVRSRALDVEFTQVRSPITGRVSDRRVDAGNLVTGGSDSGSTLLTTVYAMDPIYFRFDGSEALYLKQAREHGNAPKQVQIKLQDEPDYHWNGQVDFTDNGIDPGSGTMRGRAVVANPNYFLTPGMFGNMRLSDGGRHAALLVPDSAVQVDQARKALLVVGKDDKVVSKPVVVGALVNGLRVIRSGLLPTDRVVIEGVQFAMPGARVTLMKGKIAPVEQAAGTAPGINSPAASQATLAAR